MPELPPIATRQITSVQNNIKRVVEMVSDLLTIEKLEAGKLELELETIDIQDMVAEAMDSLMALAREKKVTMSNDCASELIQGDRKRLVQVLLNFMSNAIKFSPSGSNISVYSSRQGNIVSIGVEDRGPGLEPEDQEHIFEKFYQAEDGQRSKGFGLGLAICKLLVEAHGGEVGVDSEPGQGSVFWLSLPASPEQ
jgi:signal transduction histidine kinase